MKFGEQSFEVGHESKFKELARDLIAESTVLKDKINPDGSGDTINIIDAIEQGSVRAYIGEDANNRELEAINNLIAIFEELKKSEPSENKIEEITKSLKTYL